MTRTSHKAHATPQFPVYCLDWTDDQHLILGGGGGASRSGIENKIKIATVSKDARTVKYVDEFKLGAEEDAPMTLAIDRKSKSIITGVNASSSSVQAGKNEQCRIYNYDEDKIKYSKGKQTIKASWSDDYPYQKFTSLDPSSKYLAIGTTDNLVTLLSFPALDLLQDLELDEEVVDLDWGGEKGQWLAVTTTKALLLYHLKGDKPQLHLSQSIYPPSLDIAKAVFRSARFSPTSTNRIHAVLNSLPPPRKAKGQQNRKAWVCTFTLVAGPSATTTTSEEKESEPSKEAGNDGKEEELGRWDVTSRREVGNKPVTVFDISNDGKLIAYGCSDLSIGILEGHTLNPLLKILHAHSFPPTALKFNPSASLLVSASADNTIRAIVVPASFGSMSPLWIALLVVILAVLFGILYRK